MVMQENHDEWTARIVSDCAQRDRELRKASVVETVFSLLAAAFACAAVWGFTAVGSSLHGLDSARVGGVALIAFVGCIVIAAGGGIKKRLILLVKVLES
jgi:hypothetical protein